MPWTTEAPAHRRRVRWEREECLFERRKPVEGRHAKRTHTPASRSSPWHEINPADAFPKPAAPTRRQDEMLAFERLADQWEADTAFESLVTTKAMHPAYQRIIGMGEAAVPFVLARLQREPGQWFWALTAMTGQDPAQGEDTLEGARAAWLRWGSERNMVRD
jgi:hypothetical protein